MKVILIKDVEKLGYANDVVDVKPGYANNHLLPKGMAKVATESALKVLAENIKQRAHKEAKVMADAESLKAKLESLTLVLKAKVADEQKIYGSVTAATLADAIAEQGVEVDRRSIVLDPVKSIGEFTAVAKLHRDVKAEIKFTVVPEE